MSSNPVCDLPSLCGYISGEEVTQVWHWEYVALSLLVSFCGAFTSLAIITNLKVCKDRSWYWIFLVTAGLSVGLNTVWCMHFVGMQAIQLDGGHVSGAHGILKVKFRAFLTVISLVACWGCATGGLYLVVSGRSEPMKLTALNSRVILRLLGAAVWIAAGVLVMHYCGMKSQSGYFSMTYRGDIIVASTIVAIVVAAAGLGLLFFFGNTLIMRIVSGLVIAVAVNSVHYIGMLSAKYYITDDADVGDAISLNSNIVANGSFMLDLAMYVICNAYGEQLREKAEEEKHRAEERARQQEELQKKEMALKRMLADAVESVRELGHPLFLVPAKPFLSLTLEQVGALHEDYRQSGELKILDCMADVESFKASGAKIVFFSYECLQWARVGPNRDQLISMKASVHQLVAQGGALEMLYIWLDCLCIPQRNRKMTAAAVSCIYTFARIPDHMVIVCPDSEHQDTGRKANAASVQRRMWCRLEQVAYGCSLGARRMQLQRGYNLEPLPDDWMDAVCTMHDADSTCCRVRHTTIKNCDKEKAVVPLLAMYYDIYSRWTAPDCQPDEALQFAWQLISRRQDDMFPEYFQYSTENGHEKRMFFGDLIHRVQQLVKKEREDAVAATALKSEDEPDKELSVNENLCSDCSPEDEFDVELRSL